MADDVLTLHVLNTGWATAPEWVLMRGGRAKMLRVPALVGLLQHPVAGWGLFDTGYAPRVLAATERGLFRVYRQFAPMQVVQSGSVSAQLVRFGLTVADIRWIVISHFHADHLGGLLDFPRARWIASGRGLEDVRHRRGISALRRAFIPSLMPSNAATRIEALPEFIGPELAPFGPTHDLFGDGSLLLCSLPGHACGQIIALARTQSGPVLLAADGCWISQSYRENRPPHWLTAIFVDSVAEARHGVGALHAFALAHPDTAIVPCHCPEAHARFVGERNG